jgi:BirA family biotin operon repressor/biotin-[acetyl-CoA-carboxylase] ligase
MDLPAWPEGYGLRSLASVESTMAEAARLAPSLAGPEWILALSQTAGRGRRGRAWAMPPGNFAASLALRPDMPPDRAALFSFVAALALHDVLAALTDRPLALKWPNDVLLDGGKVAGILLESAGIAGRLDRLVVGIGVNLATAPVQVEDGALPPVALGLDLPPEAFLDRLAPAFAAREAEFRRDGFTPIRAAWLARAARLGQPIVARTGRDTRSGVFQDVDPTGALVLGTPGGAQLVAAADVFF